MGSVPDGAAPVPDGLDGSGVEFAMVVGLRGRSSGRGLRGDDDGKAVSDIDDAGNDIPGDFLVGLDHERRSNAAGRKLREGRTETVERDDLVVEVEHRLPLERLAVHIELRRSQCDDDDEAAGGCADAVGAARRFNLDAGLEHEGRTQQKKAEQEQDDRNHGRKIDQAVQRLNAAGEHQGHCLVCPVGQSMTSAGDWDMLTPIYEGPKTYNP